MKVCILSDSHDNIPLLEAAVRCAREQGAEHVLHCGDVVAPSTLGVLQPMGLPVHVIHGNNMGDMHMLSRISHQEDSVVTYHGQDAGIELADRRILLVHYPHYARAIATTGDWDIECCGHSHRAGVERIANLKGGNTRVVNPGTIGGVGAPATYILGDLAKLRFEVHTLDAATLELTGSVVA